MDDTEKDNEKRIKQKTILEKYIGSSAAFLIRHGISPNTLSYLGFMCSLGASLLIALGIIHFSFWIAWTIPFLIILGGAFDVFDGEVARRTGQDSQKGAFLDSNIDRVSDVIVILGLVYGGLVTFLLGFIILFFVMMISYTRSRAENEGLNMKGIGFMERAERVIILTAGLVVESWVYHISGFVIGTPLTFFFPIFVIIYTCLLFLTVCQRLIFVFKNLNKLETY